MQLRRLHHGSAILLNAFVSLAPLGAMGCHGEAVIALVRDGDSMDVTVADAIEQPDENEHESRDGESKERDGESTDIGLDEDPGSGTGTLSVTGEISAGSSVSNATEQRLFATQFRFQIMRSGLAVEDATVVITSAGGTVALTVAGPGLFGGSQSGYYATYHLDVTGGADRVSRARLSGPGFHTFAAPHTDAHERAGRPLDVLWSPSGAMTASIESREFSETTIVDTGSFAIPGEWLRAEPGSVQEDRIRVRRSNGSNVAGATTGSRVVVGVRNEVEFYVDGP